jgi:hypothetical protein
MHDILTHFVILAKLPSIVGVWHFPLPGKFGFNCDTLELSHLSPDNKPA